VPLKALEIPAQRRSITTPWVCRGRRPLSCEPAETACSCGVRALGSGFRLHILCAWLTGWPLHVHSALANTEGRVAALVWSRWRHGSGAAHCSRFSSESGFVELEPFASADPLRALCGVRRQADDVEQRVLPVTPRSRPAGHFSISATSGGQQLAWSGDAGGPRLPFGRDREPRPRTRARCPGASPLPDEFQAVEECAGWMITPVTTFPAPEVRGSCRPPRRFSPEHPAALSIQRLLAALPEGLSPSRDQDRQASEQVAQPLETQRADGEGRPRNPGPPLSACLPCWSRSSRAPRTHRPRARCGRRRPSGAT
jgi:hypothetical protein